MDVVWNAVQWPAMVATLVAAWLVGSTRPDHRAQGFWWFIASNVLWVVWGWHDEAYALIALQVGLFALNVRGARKNEENRLSPAGSRSRRARCDSRSSRDAR